MNSARAAHPDDAASTVGLDLSQPRYDMTTYWGRVQHFGEITDMRLAFATDEELHAAKDLLALHASGAALPNGKTADDLYKAKRLYDSAFHSQSGELMWRFGRMSFAAIGNTIIGAGMLTFYQSTPAVVFWHVANQTFNSVLNYVNRNTSSALSNGEVTTSYVAATGSATSVALGLNRVVSSYPAFASGLVGRLVPFTAVAAANCVNIPLMRRKELVDGIVLEDANGTPIRANTALEGTTVASDVVTSTSAAKWAIGTTIVSRVLLAVPGLTVPPVLITQLNRRTSFLRRFPRVELPLQLLFSGFGVALAVPLACAVFPQRSELALTSLEPAARAKLAEVGHTGPVYFNKGL